MYITKATRFQTIVRNHNQDREPDSTRLSLFLSGNRSKEMCGGFNDRDPDTVTNSRERKPLADETSGIHDRPWPNHSIFIARFEGWPPRRAAPSGGSVTGNGIETKTAIPPIFFFLFAREKED